MFTECPCCSRGTIINGKCDRCHVVIANGAEAATQRHGAKFKCRQDQDRVSPMCDYARTHEDKQ